MRDRVRRALARLSPDQRVAVLLIDQFGYSFHEAAAALDVPQGTAESLEPLPEQ